jgi:hypothetical protein
MPYLVEDPTGDSSNKVLPQDVKDANYEYDYPNELDLKPGSEVHEHVKNMLLKRARASAQVVNKRHDSWEKIDEKMTGYIPADEAEKDVKDEDERRPISIVFPYSYAMLETFLAYMTAAFIQDPIFMYEGVSPEDTVGAIMMENTIRQQCHRMKVGLNLHTLFRDAACYGIGSAAPYWDKLHGIRLRKREKSSFFGMFKQYEKYQTEEVIFEGNALDNIDPYSYLPDPTVAAQNSQEGEFLGYLDSDSILNLLSWEQHEEGIFNVQYLKHVKNKHTSLKTEGRRSGRHKKTGYDYRNQSEVIPVDLLHMHVNLIPKDWKLGTGEYPEKWSFTLGADSVLIRAKRMNLAHNLYPVVTIAPEFDGYSSVPLSRMEMLYGTQEILDFLMNSHIANVRKAINDMIIVDPYLLNLNDIKNPKYGALIRLRRPAWGRGVEKVAQQLAVTDITQNNVADGSFVMNFMDQLMGADESMRGTMRQGGPERLTKSEFQGTRAGAMSRFERIARIIGIQGMQDLGYMFASHAQQFMDEETYVKTTGRWQETLQNEYGYEGNRMKVTPFDLLIDYDVIVRDGTVPGGNFSESWITLFQTIAQQPQLAQSFDIVKIFKHIARNLGAKNVGDFENKQIPNVAARSMPDEQVEEQARQGNLVPIRGAMG